MGAMSYVFAGIATVARVDPPQKKPSFKLGSHGLNASFYPFRRDGALDLFLVLFWCAGIVGAVFPDSRLGGFNSRLGANKFPFCPLRELAGKDLI
jgi:hypothetical protein